MHMPPSPGGMVGAPSGKAPWAMGPQGAGGISSAIGLGVMPPGIAALASPPPK